VEEKQAAWDNQAQAYERHMMGLRRRITDLKGATRTRGSQEKEAEQEKEGS